eukprot:g2839.t1
MSSILKAALSSRGPGPRPREDSVANCTKTHLLKVLDCIRKVNQCKKLDDAIEMIIDEICSILECDRATLFMVDLSSSSLVVRVGKGAKNIRIPLTSGIAGSVYETGKHLNIPDAYKHPKFNKSVDAKTGYKTKSILCQPVRDSNNKIVAVLQVVNKLKLPIFTSEDELLLDHLSGQIGVILRNCQFYDDAILQKQKTEALLDICKSLHSGMGSNSLMFTITQRTPALVDADRCTLYIVDNRHDELWSMHGAVEVRIPKNVGLAGAVLTEKSIINIADAYDDERFDQEYDKKSGYRTKAVLCAPIHGSKGDIIGVLQLINKKHENYVFTEEDIDYIRAFIDIAGGILERSTVSKGDKFVSFSFPSHQTI